MNTFTKALFLLALVTISSCDIRSNLENLRGAMNKAQEANVANMAKLQDIMQQMGNKNNNKPTPQPQPTPAPQPKPTPAPQPQPQPTPAPQPQPQPTPAPTPAPQNNTNNNNNNNNAGSSLFTLKQLQEIMPNSGEKSAYYYPYLTKAMSAGGLTTCPRIAAFLAQIGHESGSLIYTTEIADGSAYEGIADIGNTSPGDGVRYKGRGVIQVTGKYNYKIVSEGLGYDFVSDPEELANAPWCIDSAVWWWNNHTLSPIADGHTQESFDKTTRIINGGYNGKADRDSRWATAKRVLGC